MFNPFLQFNSVYLYSPFSQIKNVSQRDLQSVHIDIPDLWPHIGRIGHNKEKSNELLNWFSWFINFLIKISWIQNTFQQM